MPKKRNLVGERHGRLTVTDYSHRDDIKKVTYWKCLCDCGNSLTVRHGNLQSGHTESCGCIVKEKPQATTHGMTGIKAHRSWEAIKARCLFTTCQFYPRYGGIGITIAKEYAEDFMEFYKEVGDPPESHKRYSIDRIDNNKGYVKGNMRWADNYTQARNRSISKKNSSGTTGVHWNYSGIKGEATFAMVTWLDLNTHKQRNKRFSARKYGLLECFKMACDYRKDKIIELNKQGAGYSDNHGKIKELINVII